jgi:citrate synthase
MSELTELLIEAHKKSCRRDNVSTVVLKTAWDGNDGDLYKSITAAMMTLGGIHAPIKQCYAMIGRYLRGEPIPDYYRVPGFGSSFCKGYPDVFLNDLRDYISLNHFDVYSVEASAKVKLRTQGKDLYPNIAFYTAAVARIEGHGILFCEKLLLEARVPEWIKILEEYEEEKTS